MSNPQYFGSTVNGDRASFSGNRQIEVIVHDVAIYETAQYTNMFQRPYEAQLTSMAMSTLASRVEEACRVSPSSRIRPNMMAGISTGAMGQNSINGILLPSASPIKAANIPYGWDTRRGSFLMKLEITYYGSTELYTVQGFTEYNGFGAMTPTGGRNVDDKMHFYINSFARLVRPVIASNVPGNDVQTVVENYHVINGRLQKENAPNSEVLTLRPSDVFMGIQSNYIKSDYDSTRVIEKRLDRSMDSVCSKRQNAIPSNYAASITNGFRLAVQASDFGEHGTDIFNAASQASNESTPNQVSFIMALSNIRGMVGTTDFTLSELCQLDPTLPGIPPRINFFETPDTMIDYRNYSNGWNAPDRETQAANLVAHSVVGLMVQCGFVELAFAANNLTLDLSTIVEPKGAKSITGGDNRQMLALFFQRLEMEILPDIAVAGMDTFTLFVHANVNGTTQVNIQYGNGPVETYHVPTFCDSLFSPVLTTDPRVFADLTSQVEKISTAVSTDLTSIYSNMADEAAYVV